MTLRLLKTSRILVLARHDAKSAALADQLACMGFCTDIASSTADARASIESTTPDLVLLSADGSQTLADIDGLSEPCRSRDIPLLALLDDSDEELCVDAVEQGASDYIVGPVGRAALEARICLNLRLAERIKTLRKASLVDELTKLMNRRAVLRTLRSAHSENLRSRRGLCALLIDVDSFKAINDCHGHAEGDNVLRELAAAFDRVLRGVASIGRLGGDEFVVILPDITTTQAHLVADRLREAAAATRIGATNSYVELCIGMAEVRGSMSVDELLEIADQDMYEEKRLKRAQAA